MYALTLHRPWDEAMIGVPGGPPAPKDWENRRWKLWRKLLGALVAFHAGQVYDEEAAEFIRRHGVVLMARERSDAERAGHVIGVARMTGWVRLDDGSRARAGLTAEQVLEAERSPWAFGPYAWRREEPVAIDPVPCVGRQGLWRLPPEVEKQVRKRWEEAKAV